MVANRPTTDPLVTLLDSLQRKVDETSRATRFPIVDLAGNVLFDVDADAGYGLALPITPISLNPIAGIVYNGATSPFTVARTYFIPTNPALLLQGSMITTGNTSGAVAHIRFQISEGSSGYTNTLPDDTVTGEKTTPVQGTLNSVILPESLMGKLVLIEAQSWITSGNGTSDSVAFSVAFVLGVSQAIAQNPSQFGLFRN